MKCDTTEDVIRFEEGFRSSVYECPAGYLTIGYGFNVDPHASGGIPREVADFWLKQELEDREEDLISIFGPTLWVFMGEARQAALMSMHYQLGAAGFRAFEKMIRCIKQQDWFGASQQCMDSRAARNPKLTARFMRNARALASNEWQWGKE